LRKNYHRKIRVRGGVVVSETTRSGDKTTILRYGKGLTVKKNNKVVCQEFYDPKMLRGMVKGGLWQKQWDIPLCGSKRHGGVFFDLIGRLRQGSLYL
jgi:hypothetical protein